MHRNSLCCRIREVAIIFNMLLKINSQLQSTCTGSYRSGWARIRCCFGSYSHSREKVCSTWFSLLIFTSTILFRRGAINSVQLSYLESYRPTPPESKCILMWRTVSIRASRVFLWCWLSSSHQYMSRGMIGCVETRGRTFGICPSIYWSSFSRSNIDMFNRLLWTSKIYVFTAHCIFVKKPLATDGSKGTFSRLSRS